MAPDATQVIEEFPLRQHRYVAICLLLAALLAAGLLAGWYYLLLPGYQRAHLGTYVSASAATVMLPRFKRGPGRFRVTRDLLSYEHTARLEAWRNYYHLPDYLPVFDRSALEILMPPVSAALLALFAGFIIGTVMDLNYVRALRRGIVKRGPTRMTVPEYNRKTHGDGIAFLIQDEPKA